MQKQRSSTEPLETALHHQCKMTESAHKSIVKERRGYLRKGSLRMGKEGISQVDKETLMVTCMFMIFSAVMFSYI